MPNDCTGGDGDGDGDAVWREREKIDVNRTNECKLNQFHHHKVDRKREKEDHTEAQAH